MRAAVKLAFAFFMCIPAMTAFVDMIWWFYTNHALSSIEWDSFRPVIAYIMAALGVLCVMS